MGSISKHVDDIISDDKIMNNDFIGFNETRINLSDSTFKLIKTLNLLVSILITIF